MPWYLDGEALPPSPPLDAVKDGDRLVLRGGATAVAARIRGELHVSYLGSVYRLTDRPPTRARAHAESAAASGELRAPMPGAIVEVLAVQGSPVAKGQRLVVMEAMKTQQILAAPFDGTLALLDAAPGAQVEEGRLLARVEPNA